MALQREADRARVVGDVVRAGADHLAAQVEGGLARATSFGTMLKFSRAPNIAERVDQRLLELDDDVLASGAVRLTDRRVGVDRVGETAALAADAC